MNTQIENPVSSILGATGLSKRALACYFRQTGLFGLDSTLSREQQAAVFSRLPAIAGLRAPLANIQMTAQLQAIAELTDALLGGGDARPARARSSSLGLGPALVNEICTVVADVQLVFGPLAKPAAPARSATESATALSAAA